MTAILAALICACRRLPRWLKRYARESFGTFRLRPGWWRWLPLYVSPLYCWDFRRFCIWRWHGLAVGAFGRAVYVYWGPR